MPLYLIAIRVRGRVDRLAVVGASGADALAKARAARPLAPRDAFHVARTGDGDVLSLPERGRPPRDLRVDPDVERFLSTIPTYSDIR